jgi:hypothetical protein
MRLGSTTLLRAALAATRLVERGDLAVSRPAAELWLPAVSWQTVERWPPVAPQQVAELWPPVVPREVAERFRMAGRAQVAGPRGRVQDARRTGRSAAVSV